MNTPYLLKTDVVTSNEKETILNELDSLTLQPPEETESATSYKTGKSLKKNNGLFLEANGSLNDYSTFKILAPILGKYIEEFAEMNALTGMIKQSKQHSWLVSYYDDGDYYKSHVDATAGSAVFWFYREPKLFTGGEFIFDDENINLGTLNNAVVFFPGMIVKHSITKVSLEEKHRNQKLGRYSVNVFFT